MTKLQLQLGKKYLNRRGEVVEIVCYSGHDYVYCWQDNCGTVYTDTGAYYRECVHTADLVSEYTEPSTAPTEEVNPYRHPHADCIIAWANGAVIECYRDDDKTWKFVANPSWSVTSVYRIKPEKKIEEIGYWVSSAKGVVLSANPNLTLTFEDGKLIKADVL